VLLKDVLHKHGVPAGFTEPGVVLVAHHRQRDLDRVLRGRDDRDGVVVPQLRRLDDELGAVIGFDDDEMLVFLDLTDDVGELRSGRVVVVRVRLRSGSRRVDVDLHTVDVSG
jgi:hypothetical protein